MIQVEFLVFQCYLEHCFQASRVRILLSFQNTNGFPLASGTLRKYDGNTNDEGLEKIFLVSSLLLSAGHKDFGFSAVSAL